MSGTTDSATAMAKKGTLPVRGVHHLGLTTGDMKVNIDFYPPRRPPKLLHPWRPR